MLKKIKTRLLCFGRRFSNAESGATAIEFALIAFPFFSILGIIIETGSMMFVEYGLQSGVQEASRQARTGQAQGAGMTVAQYKSLICKNAALVSQCGTNITVYANSYGSWAELSASVPSFTNIGVKDDGTMNPSAYKLGQPSCPSVLVATYDWQFMMPMMKYMGNLGNIQNGAARRLVGFAMFQTEPYPVNGGAVC
jgi:Flp pilus assembly protein TadG